MVLFEVNLVISVIGVISHYFWLFRFTLQYVTLVLENYGFY